MTLSLDRRPAAYWECDYGQVHVVDPASDAGVCNWHTKCGLRLKTYPGVWRPDSTGPFCWRCSGEPMPCDGLPSVRHWVFRTTGGVMHGVAVNRVTPIAFLETYCGLITIAKISNGTGRWEHTQPPLTCLGCLAVKDVTP